MSPTYIPHSRPSLGLDEEKAACRVLRSGMLAQGTEVAALESELAKYLGVAHVIAVNSGSAALHLSLLALNIGSKDEVLLPSYVCTALLHAIRHVGATPVLVDIVPDTLQICPDDAANKKTEHTRAILVPHMFGKAADLSALISLDLPVIEDCALALGASQKGYKLGSKGKLAAFSFYATKVICGGEGGALATSDDNLADCLRDLRDYDGRHDDKTRFNYKLTDLQAAIVRVQLSKLPAFINRRKELGERYANTLASTGAQLPNFAPGEFPFRYIVRTLREASTVISAFETRGVAVRAPVFRPLHRVLNLPDESFTNTASAHNHAVSIPLYPALTQAETDRILIVAREVLCPAYTPMS